MYNVRRYELGQSPTTTTPMTMWDAINALCLKSMTKAECQGLIGTNPLFLPPTCVKEWSFPWWGYLIAGFVAGRYI